METSKWHVKDVNVGAKLCAVLMSVGLIGCAGTQESEADAETAWCIGMCHWIKVSADSDTEGSYSHSDGADPNSPVGDSVDGNLD